MRKIFTPIAAFAAFIMPALALAQEPCTPHEQVSNNFENGLFIEEGGQLVAQDFYLYSNVETFSLNKITTNFLSQGGITTVNIYFYEDADGMPGDMYGTAIMDVVPTSQDIIGNAFGYDVHEVVLDLPTAVDFPGSNRYWLRLEAVPTVAGTQVAWEVTTANPVGLNVFFQNENATEWTDGGPDDGVFTLSGDCVTAEGCFDPINVMANPVSPTEIEVTWTELGTATEWNIEYGTAGFTPGSGTSVTDNDGSAGIVISDLEMLESFDFYVQTVCDGENSGWVGPATASLDYCVAEISNVEPITYVNFAGIENTSSDQSTESYEDFTDITGSVVLDETYELVIEGNTAGDWTNTVTVFIDWNQDLSFDPISERYDVGVLENSTGTDGQQISTDIEVPADAVISGEYTTRMRVVKMYSGTSTFPVDACTEFTFGQIEDYSLDVAANVGIVEFDRYNFTYGPNPGTDYIALKSDKNLDMVSVFDLTGKELINFAPASTDAQVNISSLSNGIYLMQVTIENQTKTFKIAKQ